jgi:precorrin-6B methylase 2
MHTPSRGVSTDEDFERFPRHFTAFGKGAARRTRYILELAVKSTDLDPKTVRSVVDFGAGFGEPTWAIRQWTGEETDITALEQKPDLAEWIATTQPSLAVVTGDGIDYLEQVARRKQSVDLITTFALGPDPTGQLSRKLIEASQEALSKEGFLLLNATNRTALAALQNVDRLGLAFDRFEPEMLPGSNSTFDTLLIPKQSVS